MDFTQPIPVSVFVKLLNTQLSELHAKVIGEVSGLKKASSGHVYFDLKDSEGTINCVVWKFKYQISGIELTEGMQIIATGKPNVYAPTGRLSFVADTIEYAGEGELKKAYDRLRAKLTSEGLFAPEKKRALPKYVKKIGVITSKQGAVIHDFENNLGQWGFKIKFVDSRVEGKDAIHDLLSSIHTMSKQDIDALVIMRGGGSRESLAAFDSEAIVRAVANFPVPVVAGIGHHEDVPLTVLAADVAVSTPTAAAHIFNKPWEELVYRVENYEDRVIQAFAHRLHSINHVINSFGSDISKSFENGYKEAITKLENFERIIATSNPERQLRLGYSIVQKDGQIVRSTKNVTIGDELSIQVADGKITSKVTQ
jgi:exodeoxyribonuclease VII large subunit